VAKRDKLLEKWRQNPQGARFEEVDRVLLSYGFSRRNRGSSHYVYSRPGHNPITIAYRKPFLHSQAVREVLQAIGELIDED
jgi:hypothetical protein